MKEIGFPSNLPGEKKNRKPTIDIWYTVTTKHEEGIGMSCIHMSGASRQQCRTSIQLTMKTYSNIERSTTYTLLDSQGNIDLDVECSDVILIF